VRAARDGIRGPVPWRGIQVPPLWGGVGQGGRGRTGGTTVALLILIGICAFALFVIRAATARARAERLREPVSPMPNLPPMPSPGAIPDTVPTAWVDDFGSGGDD